MLRLISLTLLLSVFTSGVFAAHSEPNGVSRAMYRLFIENRDLWNWVFVRHNFGKGWFNEKFPRYEPGPEYLRSLQTHEADDFLARVLSARSVHNSLGDMGLADSAILDGFLRLRAAQAESPGRFFEPFSPSRTVVENLSVKGIGADEIVRATSMVPDGLVQVVRMNGIRPPRLVARVGDRDYVLRGLGLGERMGMRGQNSGVLTSFSEEGSLAAVGFRFLVSRDGNAIFYNSGKKIRAFRRDEASLYDPKVSDLATRFADSFRLERKPVYSVAVGEIAAFDIKPIPAEGLGHYYITAVHNRGNGWRLAIHTYRGGGRIHGGIFFDHTPKSLNVPEDSIILDVRFHPKDHQTGPIVVLDVMTPSDGIVSRQLSFLEGKWIRDQF